MKQKVAVLMGGTSSEREVSIASGKEVCQALENLKIEYCIIDPTPENIFSEVANAKPNVIFNALHGTYGEDGKIQKQLEEIGINYTHSGIEASELAFDKIAAKKVYRQSNIPTPESLFCKIDNYKEAIKNIGLPIVIKPNAEGSSVGVSIIKTEEELAAKAENWSFGKCLFEQYIVGKELSCGVLNGKALGVIELTTEKEFYDYEAKYTDGVTKHIMPAQIEKPIYEQIMHLSEVAHKKLGCRSVSRTDFMLCNKTNMPYALETNTHPGLTRLSLLPEIAAFRKINFEMLIKTIVNSAGLDKTSS